MHAVIVAIATASLLATPNVWAQWSRTIQQDKMTGASTRLAEVRSSDSLDLKFPYSGENRGRLVVRRHPQHGLDVMFIIDKGQLMCRVSSCQVVVKFDKNQPVTFAASGPTDHSNTVIFLSNPKRFIDAAKKAQQILVQATYFHAGAQVLTFNTPGGLTWE